MILGKPVGFTFALHQDWPPVGGPRGAGVPVRRLAAMLLAALPVGCDCTPLDEMQVLDKSGLASEHDLAESEEAILDFAAWTGRDSVCVPGVKLVDRMIGGGHFAGRNQWIKVDIGWRDTDRLDWAVRHELCHALEYNEGSFSLDHPDIFDPQTVAWSLLYSTRNLRTREAFALACDDGPADLSLKQSLDTLCGTGLVSEARRFVMDEVYPLYPQSEQALGAMALEQTHRWVRLDLAEGEWADWGSLDPWISCESWICGLVTVAGYQEDGSIAAALNVVRVDPATGAVLQTYPVSEEGQALSEFTLLATGGDPLVVYWRPEESAAWRLDLESGALEPVHLPPCTESIWTMRAVARDDRVWLFFPYDSSYGQPLVEVDLTSGSWAAAGPASWSDIYLYSLADDGQQLLAWGYLDHQLAALGWNPDTGEHWEWVAPEGWNAYSGIPMGDGRVLAAVSTAPSATKGLALYDPVAGGWWLDEGTCDGAWDWSLDQNGYWPADFFHHDGDAWFFHEEDKGVVLTRVGLAQR